MLCRNFELIPIKVGFLKKILKLLKNLVKVPVLYAQKSGKSPCTIYSTGSLAKFWKK